VAHDILNKDYIHIIFGATDLSANHNILQGMNKKLRIRRNKELGILKVRRLTKDFFL
jgi:hypothetical protein